MDTWTLVLRSATAHGMALGLLLAGLEDIPDGDAAQLIREAADSYRVAATQSLIDTRREISEG